jgi:phage terminase large subunit-like protein
MGDALPLLRERLASLATAQPRREPNIRSLLREAGVTLTNIGDFLDGMTDAQMLAIYEEWDEWALPHQRMPPGDWRRWILRGGRGSGKALHIDTQIPTPEGWSAMGSLSVGDLVFDESGNPCAVTGVTEVMVDRECYRLTFDDGHEIIADADHEWFTWTRAARKSHQRARVPGIHPGLKTTAEIAASVMHGPESNHSVPLAGALFSHDAVLPAGAYTLGYWLGNGSKDCSRVTIGSTVGSSVRDTEPLDVIRSEGYDVRPTSDPKCWSVAGFITVLKALGVGGERGVKHIPRIYLRGSYVQRLALMQGLMDADGYQSATCPSAEFCSTDRPLADGLHELAISLGIKASIAEGRATLNGKDCGPKWRVTFTTRVPVFRLARKLCRMPQAASQATRTGHRYIIGCEAIQSVPVRCIAVDSPSHLYLAGAGMIPTHNSAAASNTLHKIARDKKRIGTGIIGIIGRTHDDVRIVNVGDPATGLLATAPSDFRIRPEDWKPGPGLITWPNGVRGRVFSADAPEAIRGNNFAFLLADELQSWPNGEETWWSVVEPAVRVGRAQIMITMTPKPLRWLRELEAKDDTIRTGASIYSNPFLNRHTLNSLEIAYAGSELAKQELGGDYIENVRGAVLDYATIHMHRVPFAPKDFKQIVVAVDPNVVDSDTSDETGIIVYGHTSDDQGYPLADESGKYDIVTGEWARKVVQVYRDWNATAVIYEANNGGAHIEAGIRAVDKSVPCYKVTATVGKKTRAEPVGQLYRRGRIHHVGDPRKWDPLEKQLTTWIPGEGKSPNNLDALVWAATWCHIQEAKPEAASFLNMLGKRPS